MQELLDDHSDMNGIERGVMEAMATKTDTYAALCDAVATRKDELRKLLANLESGDGDKDGSVAKLD